MSGKIMGRAISAVITALVFCGACLSQQGQKNIQQPPANATQTAPELQSPAKTSEGAAAFDVGKFPIGLVCDGTNIWVANGGSNTVTELRASNGAVLGTFNVGKFPIGVTFDGTNSGWPMAKPTT
jgi:YVTN family beta-propeller protein